jgi:hypothetical protein
MALLRINRHPSARQLLVFALAWLAFAAALGFSMRSHHRPGVAVACWLAGVAVSLGGVAWPRGLRLFYLGLCYATYPVGLVVSSLVLGAIYYGVLTPIGLILRISRYDPLARRFDRPAATYWHRRPAPRDPEGYFRQH